jgi:hypothetical protein
MVRVEPADDDLITALVDRYDTDIDKSPWCLTHEWRSD